MNFIAVEEADLKIVRTSKSVPAGIPANMVMSLMKLSVPSGLISNVGRNVFGKFPVKRLGNERIKACYITYDHERNTGVAIVQLKHIEPSLLLYDHVI